MKKYFVTGIGTDVGKTLVSAILTEALQADYWKPVQCGRMPHTDSLFVKSLLSNKKSVVHPEAFILENPVSPHAAAAMEGRSIEMKNIIIPASTNQVMIIEGAGGLLVPLNNEHTVADMILHLNANAIVVSSFYLGSINHTLLTCSELKHRNIPVAGIIFNGEYNEASAAIISKQTKLPLLGIIPSVKQVDKSIISTYAELFKAI